MIINTRDFGEVEIVEEELITFPVGLFAFEGEKRFALLSPLGEDVYPKWLQSADDVSPCFVVFDPTIIDTDYSVRLETFEEKLLKLDDGITDNTNVSCLVIATVPNDFKKTVVNMKAPVVVNLDNALAVQSISPFDYEFRYPLYSEQSEQSGDSEHSEHESTPEPDEDVAKAGED